jgi:hypothetical protein
MGRMKSVINQLRMRFLRPRLIKRWGRAELVCWPDGRLRLHGGSPADRQAALEWISLFAHETIPVNTPAPWQQILTQNQPAADPPPQPAPAR